MKEGEFHLTVLAVLCTEDKKILITKRAMSKKWAGGHWEIPGGGVKSKESSYEAIVREVSEETDIDLTNNKGELLYTYKRENPHEGDNYFVDVYGFNISKEDVLKVKVQEEEVDGFKFATISEIEAIANFYDYFEIQPLANNEFMIENEKIADVTSKDDLRELNCKIAELGEKFNKPVVATCDAHFLNPGDEIYRKYLLIQLKACITFYRKNKSIFSCRVTAPIICF